MIKNFFNVAGADAVKRIAEWIRHKFYTKAEIDDMLSAGMKYEVVEELPATGEAGTVYLVPKQSAGTGDVYDEYIYVDGSFEHIGSTEIDLSNYYTKAQTDNLLGDKVDKESGKGLSTEDFTTAEKNKLGGIEAGAEVNVQADWNESDSTKDDYIKNKPTLRQPSTDGTAGQYLKSNGNGNSPSWETMDSSPTANSTKAVTSGGVKTALDGKQASISITTKTDDAGDNDKVILQANGVTDTTTFVRRSLTNIRDWLLKKLIPEELLKWGGLNGQGERTALGVIDSTLINNIRANRVAWLTADHFAVEYSRDGGTTWQNSRHIDDIMNWTSSPTGTNIYIGDADAEHIATSAYMTRITLTTAPSPASSNNYTFYCKIVKMCFYVATMGSTGCKINVYLRTQANVESNTDTWVHVAEDCALTGWSGWNIINFPSGIVTYGNNKSAQYGQIRMVFSADGYSGNGTTNYGLSLQRLRVYAPDCWGVGNSLANYDSPFAFYADRHVVFPSTVTATQLIKSGGTDSQLLVADGSVISMPIAIAKGGTGATTAFKAEYNINTNVRNSHLTGDISDNSRIAFCSTAPSTTNGVFAGYRTMSQVWTWIKTHFDSSPTSGSGNGITSGGVYTALEEKVNLQPDFTASQIDYSAGNVGKWQKVLRFPDGADLVINMKKTAMGSDTTSTLWYSSSSMGESYTSLFGNHSVRFVRDGGYVFLCLACRKSTNEPIESYTFQIAHSSVPMSDIVAVTDASPISATPKEPNIVYRAPMTTGAVSFNVTNGAGSVSMANHNDFLGNMTSEASNGVVVTMSGATEGQIYRFVFTRNITGGVTFKQSNVAYCTISGDVNAGDTITLTAVSNTENGWLYEKESAGMTSTDGSVSIDYSSGIPDLSVETVPFNNLVNKAMFQEGDSPNPLAVGEEAEAVMYASNGDILRTDTAQVWLSSVNGGDKAYSHSVTIGETYSVKIGSDTVSYTATASGSLFVCNTRTAWSTESVTDGIWRKNGVTNFTVVGAERVLTLYIIAVTTNTISFSKFDIINFINRTSVQYQYSNYWNTAVGKGTKCLSYASLALGYSYAYGGFSLALHRGKALGYSSIAIGNSTANNYCLAIGNDANALFDNNCIAIGNSVMARGDRSLSLGCQNYSDGQEDVSLGVYCKSGRLVTRDSVNYDRLLIKKFPLAKFSVAGSQCFGYKNISNVSESVTLTYSGNSYVVNVEPNRTLMLVNDADAVNIYESVFGGIEIDGVTYATVGSYSLSMFTLTPIVGNVYAITIFEGFEEYGDESSSSAYIYAHYTKSDYSSSYGIAVGNSCESVDGGKAFGHKLVAMNYYQTVLGRYNRLSDSSKFMIGGGTTDANRKNILEIDYEERLRVRSYVGETQEIDMNQQTGSLDNITKSVYRIRWDDTGTVNLTLGTSGCVEGQRVTIFAETNDVQIRFTSYLIPAGQFADFLFIAGAWRPYSGIGRVPTA